MGKGIKINGIKDLKRKLNDTEGLKKQAIDNAVAIDIKCPKCQKSLKVPLSGTTCSCGQKITIDLKN